METRPKWHFRSTGSSLPCSILLIMILAVAVAGLAGCAGLISSNSPTGTQSPDPPALQIVTSSLPAGMVGNSYSATLSARGGAPPYAWSTANGALPAGLQLNASTGTISGTPTAVGNSSFMSQVKDAKSASASASLSLSISPAPTPTISGVAPNSGPTSGGTTVTISGTNFRAGAIVQFGSSAAAVQVVNTAQIRTVTPAEASGMVGVTVKNTDGQSITAPNAFNFLGPTLQIVTSSFPVGTVGGSYSATLSAAGGTPPYAWSIVSGALPAGLQLNTSTGTISGTPTTAGSSSFTSQVKDAAGASTTASFSLSISSAPAPTISGVSPNSGPTSGGTTVTISGNNFKAGAIVQFGGVNAGVQSVSATQIQAVTPAEASGTVNVNVQNTDGQKATATNAFTFSVPAGGTRPVTPTASSDPNAPKIFNASSSASPGDIISLQGVHFDPDAQVWLAGLTANSATQLTIVNRIDATWIAAKLPQSASGAMVLWISNSHGASKSVALNGAVPNHLDAMQIIPGGAFRILGRNLLMPGFTPNVTVDGSAATINAGASNENMLVVNAPGSLRSTSAAVIMIDNGNGTDPVQLDRTIAVVQGSGDPFGLGTGWGAGFVFSGRVIKVITGCNGSQDDSGNIQAAINSAASGGGVVQLPSGNCRLTRSLSMKSNVVLRGAGKDVTTIKYDADYPVFAQGCDLIGMEDLTFVNSGLAKQGPLWEQNTRSFVQRVKIDMGTSFQLFFTNNKNLVIAQTDFIQKGSINQQGPYVFMFTSGLIFSNNTTTSIDGSPSFQAVHDALFLGNRFTRDASHQNQTPVIVTHRFVMDFSYRISVIGNTFDVTNGPITNRTRNDGETLLTEGGGGNRTENLGSVSSATSNTVSDPNNTINMSPFGNGTPENLGIAIVDGAGAGQTREIVGYSNHTMQVDAPWEVIPDTTSHYATFVWGLEKSILKGNTLSDNPRGIWLYETAIREVDVLANTMTNDGGIYLRTFQSQTAKQFDPMFNVRIRNNKVTNSNGIWMSYLDVVFVNKDKTNFGISNIGIEIGNNVLTANSPNVTSLLEDYAGQEGFMNLMRIETSGGQLGSTPMILGTIFSGNQCSNCNAAFIIGTGAYGTVLINNRPLPSSPNFLLDWKTIAGLGGSIGTVIQ